MLDLAIIPVLAAHLLLLYLAIAAPWIAIWLAWRDHCSRDTISRAAAWRLLWQSNAALALAVLLGAAALAALWSHRRIEYASAIAAIPTERYWFGLAELGFYFACVCGMIALCRRPMVRRGRFLLFTFLGLAAGSNLAYHFPPLFTILSVLTTRRDLVERALSFTELLAQREILARVAHHELAAFIVGGVALSAQALAHAKAGAAESARRLATWGGRIAVAAAMLQMASGIWVLVAMAPGSQARLLGGDLTATSLLGLSVLAAILHLQRLSSLALGDFRRREIVAAMFLLTMVVVFMVATRQINRGHADLKSDPASSVRAAWRLSGGYNLLVEDEAIGRHYPPERDRIVSFGETSSGPG